MKKLLIMALFVSALFSQKMYHSIEFIGSYQDALVVAKEQKRDLLVFSYTDYCPWCDRMKKYTLEDFKVVNFVGNNYVFAYVNRDSGDLPSSLQSKYVPMTFKVSHQDESVLATVGGYKQPDDYVKALK